MTQLIESLKIRWRNISERERVLLTVASTITVAIFLYAGLWKPMHKSLDKLRLAAPEAHTQLAWMRNQRGLVGTLKQKHHASPTSNILPIIETSIIDHGLSDQMRILEPVENNGARINFDGISFNLFTKWISVIDRKHGIFVVAVNVDKTDTTGLVSVRLVLRSSV